MPVGKGGEYDGPEQQLPEWQQKSLLRLPDRYPAHRVPNSEKLEGKWRSLRGAEEGDVGEQCVIADLDSSRHLQRLWIKLVPFVRHTAFLGNLTPERGQAGLHVTKRCSYLNTCRDRAEYAYPL
jgi:hypothetical protein